MSYKSEKKNNLSIFFCSVCDKLMNNICIYFPKSSLYLCEECLEKVSVQEEGARNESIEEICGCLKEIEETVRITKNPELKTPEKKVNCQICEEKREATIYCLNDEMSFCEECFESEHQSKKDRNHKTKPIEELDSQNNKNEKNQWFCPAHKGTPIFCVDHQIMFCVDCSIEEHSRHQTQGVKEKAHEEKKRVNLKNFQNSLNDRIMGFIQVEDSLKLFKKILEDKWKLTNQMLKEVNKCSNDLVEAKDHWEEIENELNEKEWCKKEFVNNVEKQIEKVHMKWEKREKEMIQKTKDIINETEKNLQKVCVTLIKEEQEIEQIELQILKRERQEKDPWYESTIISNKEKAHFLTQSLKEIGILKKPSFKPKKIFQASKYAFSSSKFHSHCDNQGKTVVLIQSTNGRTFGGFSNVPWTSNKKNCVYTKDEEGLSFLISLDEMRKFPLIDIDRSIQYVDSFGPIFGDSDLYLSNQCNLNTNSNSLSNRSYLLPSNSILAGSQTFQVKEYEVWKVE